MYKDTKYRKFVGGYNKFLMIMGPIGHCLYFYIHYHMEDYML